MSWYHQLLYILQFWEYYPSKIILSQWMAINLGRLFFHWVKFAVFLCKNSPYSELFWSAFFSHFSAFGLNTERYFVSLCIQCECEKNVDQNNSEYGHFLRSGFLAKIQRSSICSWRDHSLKKNFFRYFYRHAVFVKCCING